MAISRNAGPKRKLYSLTQSNGSTETVLNIVENINAYLAAGQNLIVEKASNPIAGLTKMMFGDMPRDGGHLLMSRNAAQALNLSPEQHTRFVRRISGSAEFIKGLSRYCLWIEDQHLEEAMEIEPVRKRIEAVRTVRLASRDKGAHDMATRSHQFREMYSGRSHSIVVTRVSSENREYLPVGLLPPGVIVSDRNFALYDAPVWHMALIASKLHLVWAATVCGKLETRLRYSSTMGWNTFPVPKLTAKNRHDLTRAAENILLAREAHFPATIADLYKPKTMPKNLQNAHNQNDEIIERIYIGRKFKNNTERLEKLFDMYMAMVGKGPNQPPL